LSRSLINVSSYNKEYIWLVLAMSKVQLIIFWQYSLVNQTSSMPQANNELLKDLLWSKKIIEFFFWGKENNWI